jgi:hypothetical protein
VKNMKNVSKILSVVFGLVLFSLPVAMVHASNDFANVQSKSGVFAAGTNTLTFNSNVTAGDLILVSIGTKGAKMLPTTPTDSQGNTFTAYGDLECGQNGSQAQRSLVTFWAFANSTGSDTVTLSNSSYAYEVIMREFSGSFHTPDPEDVFPQFGNTPDEAARCQANATAISPAGFNLSQNTGDDLVYAVTMSPNNTPFSFTGFGTWSGGVFTADSSLGGVNGEEVNGALKGSIADQYILDLPAANAVDAMFGSSTAVETASSMIMFRHN